MPSVFRKAVRQQDEDDGLNELKTHTGKILYVIPIKASLSEKLQNLDPNPFNGVVCQTKK